MDLALRIKNLETETSFKISEIALEWKNQEYKIYPLSYKRIEFPNFKAYCKYIAYSDITNDEINEGLNKLKE